MTNKPDYAAQTEHLDPTVTRQWIYGIEKKLRTEGKQYVGRVSFSEDDKIVLYEAWAGGLPEKPPAPAFFKNTPEQREADKRFGQPHHGH